MDLGVIICHFAPEPEHRRLLARTVASVREQEGKDVELTVVDDGSPWVDKEFGAAGSIRVFDRPDVSASGLDLPIDRLISRPRTGHFGKAILLNKAVTVSHATHFVFLDDDCEFERGDSLEKFRNLLSTYRLIFGRIRHAVGHYRRWSDRKVQGKNYAMERELVDEIGGFGEYTARWGGGVDSDMFWKCFQALVPPDSGRRKACFAGDIVVRDAGVHRRVDCIGEREAMIREFIEMHGVHPHHNPSRSKARWLDHSAGDPDVGERGYALANLFFRPLKMAYELRRAITDED